MTDPVRTPDGATFSAPRRLGPDVGLGEVLGAGLSREVIRSDVAWQDARRKRAYRDQAVEVARKLGYELPQPQNPFPGDEWTPQSRAADLSLMLQEAREKHPDAFAGLPITDDELEERVIADSQAELADAQATLAAAPDTFLGRTLPEFLGGAAAQLGDPLNLGISAVTMGAGTGWSLARVMLLEALVNAGAEAGQLPAQFRQAERLGVEPPNPLLQLGVAATFGALLPAGVRGLAQGGRVVGRGAALTNQKLAQVFSRRGLREELTDAQRGALTELEKRVAEETVGPAGRGVEQPGAIDAAAAALDAGDLAPPAAPPVAAEAVERLITPPRLPAPADPAAAAAAARAAPQPQSVEEGLGALIRDAEARGGYDTVSDFTVIPPEKPLTSMTLNEIDQWQSANRAAGARSTAAGGYQIIRDTLRSLREELGLTGDEVFTAELQDRLAVALMDRRGLAAFKRGELSAEEFADNLAGEWAGLPLAGGRSAYAGDGMNNATISRGALMAVLGGAEYTSVGRPVPRMTRIPARQVQVDARVYQFRSDVNAAGVGTALARVREWDELLAGDVIVHQRRDGGLFIADGHHRTDLARRLEAEGHPPIEFNGFVLREADGYTVEHVRALAAVKNIEAGNATAIDAAKVLRVDPSMLEKLTLRNSAARDARGLMKLDDEGFDMVTNGLVPEPYAAFVGELTADAAMQSAILRTLSRTRPRSIAEARQIAQDAMRAGLERRQRGAQASLFGDDFDQMETLFSERARILSATFARLKQDARLFGLLVRERSRIGAAGNVLDTATNAERANTDATALALIEKLVNRAGPIDDALTAAARRVRSGGTFAAGVRDFAGTVREAVEGGNLARLLDGADGSAEHAAAADARAVEGAGEGGWRAAETGAGEGSEAPALTEPGAAAREDFPDLAPGLFDDPALEPAPDPAAALARQGDAFSDPSPDAPAVAAQVQAAGNVVQDALQAGEDLTIPTGRIIDGAAETVSARDLLADLDADDDFLELLDACKF